MSKVLKCYFVIFYMMRTILIPSNFSVPIIVNSSAACAVCFKTCFHLTCQPPKPDFIIDQLFYLLLATKTNFSEHLWPLEKILCWCEVVFILYWLFLPMFLLTLWNLILIQRFHCFLSFLCLYCCFYLNFSLWHCGLASDSSMITDIDSYFKSF